MNILHMPADILLQIGLRLDIRSLLRLVSANKENRLENILSRDHFWHTRSEYLQRQNIKWRPNVHWKKISLAIEESLLRKIIYSGFDYLPSILVLEEIYGPPNWTSSWKQKQVWKKIGDPEVLNYLLEKKYIDLELESIQEALEESAKEGREQMIEPLLVLLNNEDEDTEAVTRALSNAVRARHLNIVKMLYDHLPPYIEEHKRVELSNLLLESVRGRHIDIIRFLLKKHEYDSDALPAVTLVLLKDDSEILEIILNGAGISEDNLQDIFEDAIDRGMSKSVQLLLKREVRSEEEMNWESMLDNAILKKHYSFIEYLLPHCDPEIVSRDILRHAVLNQKTLNILLSDYRIDPMLDIDYILHRISRKNIHHTRIFSREMIYSKYEECANILANDERVEVEDLSIDSFILFVRALSSSIEDNMIGFILAGGQTIGREVDPGELLQYVKKEDSIYGLLLRYILIKRPSAYELLDWMIERGDEKIIQAASSIIEDRSETESEIVPIRALLLCMLYPDLTLLELMNDLRIEGALEKEVRRSAYLIGVFLGRKIILARE